LDEWAEVRSSKVTSLIELLQWHLKSDNRDVFKNLDKPPTEEDSGSDVMDMEDGGMKDLTGLMNMGTQKILVYMEFPMMAPLLVSVSPYEYGPLLT
jgi:hypothetical protein